MGAGDTTIRRLAAVCLWTAALALAARAASASGGDILIVYADASGPPTALQLSLLGQTGVTSVDLFDAAAATPTLATLAPYETVVPMSNAPFQDSATLGDHLADYVDAGGVVVQLGFAHYGPNQAYGVNGRWVAGSYNPYSYGTVLVSGVPFTLGAFDPGDPLMQGVSQLASNFQNVVAPAPGATQVAAASNGNSLVARRVVGVRTTYAVTAYVGVVAAWSGDFARLIVNAPATVVPVSLQHFQVE